MADHETMTVAYVTSAFHPRYTGAGYAVLWHAQLMKEKGVEGRFIVDDYDGRWRSGGEYDGFPVNSFPLFQPGKLRRLKGIVEIIRFSRALRGHVDLVHLNGADYMGLLAGRLLAKCCGAPLVLAITLDEWDTPDGVAKSKYGNLALRSYRDLDGVVAQTEAQAVKCRTYGCRGLVRVIPNKVNTERFRPATAQVRAELRSKYDLPRDAFVLLYFGWLSIRKGMDILFKTWETIRERVPGSVLVCAGDYGNDLKTREDLQTYLRDNGCGFVQLDEKRLRYFGRTDMPEDFYRLANVFVYPSRWEGFPAVVLEAMACGVPVVINDLPGVGPELVPHDGVGFRIRQNELAGYVNAIERLASDQTLHHAIEHAGRDYVRANFDARLVTEKYVAFYNDVLAARNKRRRSCPNDEPSPAG